MPAHARPDTSAYLPLAMKTDDEEDKDVKAFDQSSQVQSWSGILWDTNDLPPDEKRLLFKVDASLLIFASASHLIQVCK